MFSASVMGGLQFFKHRLHSRVNPALHRIDNIESFQEKTTDLQIVGLLARRYVCGHVVTIELLQFECASS